jgi:uncharacterized protein YbjT (DUF2867 family)
LSRLHVLVVGSTSRHGGAVALALLQAGHRVRALTRNLAHPAANVLRMRGARLAWASLDDERRVADEVRDIDAIFALPAPDPADPAAEVRRALLLVELARERGVAHFVYASVPPADRPTGVADWDGKHEVEQYLRVVGVPHTVVCPAFFMDHLQGEWVRGRLARGELPLPLPPGRKLQQLAVDDSARFVRLVLEQRERFLQRRICIAADEQTPIEMAATLARVAGHRIQHVAADPATLRSAEPRLALELESQERAGPRADIAALRRDYPEVNWHTLDGWAKRQQWP